MNNKVFLLLIILMNVVSIFAHDTKKDGIWYNLSNTNHTATVTYKGSSYDSFANEYTGAIVIPSTITDHNMTYTVTSIGPRAFYNCSSLTSVTIPNSVTSIQYYAFYGCSGLTSVTIGNGVTSIGGGAFHDCRVLTSVTIPNSVTSIGGGAFEDCCGLTSVTIPINVTNIGQRAFSGCNSLTSVIWNAKYCDDFTSNSTPFHYDNEYIAFDLRAQITSFTFGSEVERIPAYICSGMTIGTSVTLGNSVTSIGEGAFSDCDSLTSVTLGNSVTSIGEGAFSDCDSLTSVTLGNSVKSIGDYAFSGCGSLTSVTLGNSVTSIGGNTFKDCHVNEIHYGGSILDWCTKSWNPGLISSDYSLFMEDDEMIYLEIPNTIKTIGSNAFNGCSSLTSVTIGNSVTSIGQKAFNGCSSLTSMTIGKSVTSIGDYAFFNCDSLTSVTINSNSIVSKNYSTTSTIGSIFGDQVKEYILGDSILDIGNYAFKSCGITSVTIGNGVRSIGNYAFYYCSHLTSMAIGSNVTSIRNYAFQNCNNLTSLTIGNSVKGIGDYAFKDCHVNEIHYDGSIIDWCTKSWNPGLISSKYKLFISSEKVKNLLIPDSVENIGGYAFKGCSSLNSIEIPNSVKSIGGSAFYYCDSLTSVIIGDSVESIGYEAFYDCKRLKSISIGNSVKSIGSNAFTHCNNLDSVHIKNIAAWCAISFASSSSNPLTYAYYLYFNGEIIRNLVIPDSVTSIGNYAFVNCSLRSLTIPNSVTNIGSSAFAGCDGLRSVIIGDSVTSIGSSAFHGCFCLPSITIPNSVTSIGDYAFFNCLFMESVTMESATPPILGEYCFYKDNSPNTSLPLNISIYVPCGSLEDYKTAEEWSVHKRKIQYSSNPYSITIISENGTVSTNRDSITICDEPYITCTVTPDFGYHFMKWNDNITDNPRTIELTQDTMLTAIFERNSYSITTEASNVEWGITFGDTTVLYLDTIEISAISKYGYHFVQWSDGETANPRTIVVVADMTYEAIFEKNNYTITWQNEDGSLIDQTTLEYGVVPSHAEPTKEATAEYTYTFAGWTPEVVAVTGDATYIATFNSTKNKYLIVFQDEDGTELKSEQVEYGEMPIAPAAPSKEPTSEYIYTFAGWMPEIVVVTKDATYTATYDATPVSEGVEEISSEDIAPQKVMIDGNVYILRGEKVYTLQGQEIK